MKNQNDMWQLPDFDKSGFSYALPFEMLKKYAKGELNEQESQKVESYIEKNPVEKDALEGLKMMIADKGIKHVEEKLIPDEKQIRGFLDKHQTRMLARNKNFFAQIPMPGKIKNKSKVKEELFTEEGLEFISNFNRKLQKKRTLEEAYEFICETLKIALNCRSASIFLYGPSGKLERKHINGFYKGLMPPAESFKRGEGFVGKAVGSRDHYGETRVCNDKKEIFELRKHHQLNTYIENYEQALYYQHGKREQINHIIVAPLDAFRRSSGVIRVMNKLDKTEESLDPKGFSEKDKARLQLIAALSSSALSYLKLEKRENALNNIPNLLNEYGPESVFDEIAKSLINESTLYSYCIIRLVEPRNRYLLVEGSSIDKLETEIKRIKVEEGVTGTTFYSDKHEIIQDMNEDPKNFIFKDWAKNMGIRTMICFPLKSSHKNINYGVLSVYTRFNFKFGKDDIKHLKSFAKQVSRIVESIQDDKEQRLLKEISRDLIKESNTEHLMWRVSEALPQITGFDKCRFLMLKKDSLRVISKDSPRWKDIPLNNKIGKLVRNNPDKIWSFKNIDHEKDLDEIRPWLTNIRSLVLIPISSLEKGLHGVIALTSLKNREVHIKARRKAKVIDNLVNRLNLDLLQTICNLFSVAIEKQKEREAKEILFLQLKEEEHRLKTIIEKVPDLIYIKNTKHEFILVNQAQAEVLGLENPEDAITETDIKFFGPVAAAKYHLNEVKLFRGEVEVINVEEEVIDQTTKELKIFATTKRVYKNSEGEIIGLIGIGRDITDLKNSVMRLKQAHFEAQNEAEIIKHRYRELKYSVGVWSKRLVAENDRDSRIHLYARILAADFFVEKELIAKYLSSESLKSQKSKKVSLNSLFEDGFGEIIKLIPEALGEKASIELRLDEGARRNLVFDKQQIQDIILSLVMNALRHKATDEHPTIYIETYGNYLTVKNNCKELPQNIEKLQEAISSSEYNKQGSTLFTIDKYFKENYKQDIDIDFINQQFIVKLPMLSDN